MATDPIECSKLFSVKGLVAVVTGGGTGIGLMITQALETNGAIVYIAGRRKDVLDRAVKTAKHGNIHAIQADVTKKSSLERAAAEIKSKHGYVNAVIANSGITGPMVTPPVNPSVSDLRKHLCNFVSSDFNNTFAVNTTGVYNTVAVFLELLDAGNKKGNVQQKSQVVAISSIAALSRSSPVGYAYGASKAALNHLMKAFASTLVPFDIRSNVIAPGPYPSEMAAPVLKMIEKEGGFKKSENPAERAGDAQDMAGVALFLLSQAGAYINGNVIVTDGGILGVIPSSY